MYLKLSGKIMKTYSKTHTLNENYRLANEISEWVKLTVCDTGTVVRSIGCPHLLKLD